MRTFHHIMLTKWFCQLLAFAFLFPNCSRQRVLGRTGRLRQVLELLISHLISWQYQIFGQHGEVFLVHFSFWSVLRTQSSSISEHLGSCSWSKLVFPDGLSTRDLFVPGTSVRFFFRPLSRFILPVPCSFGCEGWDGIQYFQMKIRRSNDILHPLFSIFLYSHRQSLRTYFGKKQAGF